MQRLVLATSNLALDMGFAKAYHYITRKRKGGRGPGLGELPKISGFRSIFTHWLKLPTSNLVHRLTQFGFAKAYNKIPYRTEKSGRGPVL